jgi:hypothetical protein
MKAARFGRVKNTLTMGFGEYIHVHGGRVNAGVCRPR